MDSIIDLTTQQQAIEYITRYMNANNNYSPQNIEYWIVSECELSERKDFWLGYGNAQGFVKYNNFDYCYVGGSGFVINRRTGEIRMLVSQTPKDYVQRQYDILDAKGKIYGLLNPLVYSGENILLLKKTFDISIMQAKFLLKEMPIWFVGEKLDLHTTQNLLKKKNLNSPIIVIERVSTPTFYLTDNAPNWTYDNFMTLNDFLELQDKIYRKLINW